MTAAGATAWTGEELREAIRMWGSSSASAIAEHFNLTRSAVIARLHRAGVPPKRKRGAALKRAVGPPIFRGALEKIELQEVQDAVLPLPGAQPILFVDRREHQCGWVLGDPVDCGVKVLVCGAPKNTNVPYCEYHAAMATRTK